MAILTSVFSVLAVVVFIVFFPSSFIEEGESIFDFAINLTTWASFLVLTGIIIGFLYDEKEKRIKELKEASLIILEILSKYLTSLENFNENLSFKVANLSAEIAGNLFLKRSEIENIRVAGFLFEFGKSKEKMELFKNAAKLIERERESREYYGEKEAVVIYALNEVLKEVAPIISAYHKYYASRPEALLIDFDKIPLGASIIALSEKYYNLIEKKPNGSVKSDEEAKKIIEEYSGVLFPQDIVEAFKKTTVYTKIIH
jgi:response regulator RpfG family c-di-GMP phosphodiesterase